MKKLLLIDGHNILFRSFGMPYKFYSAKKVPLHVVTTFLRFIRRSLSILGTNDDIFAAIVFDTNTASDNHLLLDAYKANRIKDYSQLDDHPFLHLPYIQQALEYLRFPVFAIPGIEADDVIATIRKQFLSVYPSDEVYIVSTDSDFYQLLDRQTFMIKHGTNGKSTVLTKEAIETILGISVTDYVYFKSLVGDKADNIKGINGIGKIRAAKIIHGTFPFDTTMYQDILDRNKQLITLNSTCDIPIAIEGLPLGRIMHTSNAEIFAGCAF